MEGWLIGEKYSPVPPLGSKGKFVLCSGFIPYAYCLSPNFNLYTAWINRYKCLHTVMERNKLFYALSVNIKEVISTMILLSNKKPWIKSFLFCQFNLSQWTKTLILREREVLGPTAKNFWCRSLGNSVSDFSTSYNLPRNFRLNKWIPNHLWTHKLLSPVVDTKIKRPDGQVLKGSCNLCFS